MSLALGAPRRRSPRAGTPAPLFLRFGRDPMEPLREAIGNPRREAADTQAREETARAQAEYPAKVQRAAQEQAAKQEAEHEARRPVRRLRGEVHLRTVQGGTGDGLGHPEGLPPAPVRRLQAEGRRRCPPSG
ncbi:hypothetical protein GCM10010275_55440 [Streptomyces litmocidini]|nr:hypothetical protein GCM10010275_55440 [Streptomyces litmocidini]